MVIRYVIVVSIIENKTVSSNFDVTIISWKIFIGPHVMILCSTGLKMLIIYVHVCIYITGWIINFLKNSYLCFWGLKDVKLEEKEQNMMTKEIREEKKRGSGCFSMSWKRKMQKQPRTSKCIFLICLPHLFKASWDSNQ